MKKKSLPFIFLSAFALTTPKADAQIYQWKDKDGRVVFGDTVPASGVVAEPMALPNAASPTPHEPAAWSAKERAFQQRRISRENEQAKAEKAESEKRLRCEALLEERRSFQALRGRRVVSWNKDKGDYEYLTDEDRATMEKQLQEAEKRLCE
jgi:hypothetical protein